MFIHDKAYRSGVDYTFVPVWNGGVVPHLWCYEAPDALPPPAWGTGGWLINGAPSRPVRVVPRATYQVLHPTLAVNGSHFTLTGRMFTTCDVIGWNNEPDESPIWVEEEIEGWEGTFPSLRTAQFGVCLIPAWCECDGVTKAPRGCGKSGWFRLEGL